MMGEGWTREICSEDRLMCKCSWGVVEIFFCGFARGSWLVLII